MWTPFETSNVRSPRWDGDTHTKFMHYAALVFDSDISASNRQIAENAAPEPDSWAPDYVPCLLYRNPISCAMMTTFSHEIVQHYTMYYNPDGLGPGIAAGGAPDETQKWADKARDLPNTNTDKYKYLGYASHFLTDVGNPEHTGKVAEQIANRPMHDYYEGWVWTELPTLQYEMYFSQDYSKTTNGSRTVGQGRCRSISCLSGHYL